MTTATVERRLLTGSGTTRLRYHYRADGRDDEWAEVVSAALFDATAAGEWLCCTRRMNYTQFCEGGNFV